MGSHNDNIKRANDAIATAKYERDAEYRKGDMMRVKELDNLIRVLQQDLKAATINAYNEYSKPIAKSPLDKLMEEYQVIHRAPAPSSGFQMPKPGRYVIPYRKPMKVSGLWGLVSGALATPDEEFERVEVSIELLENGERVRIAVNALQWAEIARSALVHCSGPEELGSLLGSLFKDQKHHGARPAACGRERQAVGPAGLRSGNPDQPQSLCGEESAPAHGVCRGLT